MYQINLNYSQIISMPSSIFNLRAPDPAFTNQQFMKVGMQYKKAANLSHFLTFNAICIKPPLYTTKLNL